MVGVRGEAADALLRMPAALAVLSSDEVGAMRPRSVQALMAESVKSGVNESVQEEVRGRLAPGRAHGFGFTVGALILSIGYALRARRRRMQKIERKVDMIVEEVADGERLKTDAA